MRIVSTYGKVLVDVSSSNSSMSGLDLSSAKLNSEPRARANFRRCTLTSAELSDGTFTGADFSYASLEGAACEGANFESANFEHADLYWAIAFGASFRSANLRFADLRGADLDDVDFSNANLEGANFGRDNLNGSTSLCGANLESAHIANTVFSGAEYDATTKLPAGLDPTSAGMIFRVKYPPPNSG